MMARRVARTEVECTEVAPAEREALRPGAEARHAWGVCVPGVRVRVGLSQF